MLGVRGPITAAPQPFSIDMGDVPKSTIIADLKADPEYDQNLILDTTGNVRVWGQHACYKHLLKPEIIGHSPQLKNIARGNGLIPKI